MRHVVAALDQVDEAIVVLSTRREIRYLNRTADRLFDGGQRRIPLPSNAWKQIDHGLPWSGETVMTTGDGTDLRLRIKVQQVLGFDGQPCSLLIVRDMTEVQRLQSIAESVNLSDNLGHFLSGIRHELGNPVNSIKTALTVLRANLDTFDHDKVDDYLDRVLGEIGRIEYLLRSLRSFSSHESVKLQRVQLRTLLDEIEALVRPNAARGIELRVATPPDELVIADRRAVCQIMLNLISNGIEAQQELPRTRIDIECNRKRRAIEIAVIDGGRGIAEKDLARVTRPFFTTKRTGTGLGLVIAQRLAENQGGTLRLESEPGKGTRAILSLAAVRREVAP